MGNNERGRSNPSFKLRQVKIEVTNRCNLKCSFCHQEFGKSGKRERLSFERFKWILDVAKDSGIRSIRITGGEPFTLKEILHYIEASKEGGFNVVVNTNATLLTREIIKSCVGRVDHFKISLPTFDEKEMTALTGSSFAWMRKWEALSNLLEFDFQIDLLTVMTPSNIDHFDDLARMIVPLRGASWIPLRQESNFSEREPVSKEKICELSRKMLSYRHQSDSLKDLQLHLAVPFCVLPDPSQAMSLFVGRKGCAPFKSLVVSAEGNFMSCYSNRAPLPLEEHRGDLNELARSSGVFKISGLPEICRSCRFLNDCLGGCRSPYAMKQNSHGLMDYLATPENLLQTGLFMNKAE